MKSEVRDVKSTVASMQETLKEVAELENISFSQTKGEVDRMDLKGKCKKGVRTI